MSQKKNKFPFKLRDKIPTKPSKNLPHAEEGPLFYLNVAFRVLKSLTLIALIVAFLGGMLAAGIGIGYIAYLVEDTPTPTKTELREELGDVAETSALVYADDQNIATIKSDPLRKAVSSDQISPLVKEALISTEDENFEEHNGVVPKAVARALISEVTGFGGGSGGSTLTQQLVKQQILTSETSFKRKANDIMLAVQAEQALSKDEILTAYLNVSPFGRNNKGQNIAGVQEAAQGIFGKNATDLNLPQAAFIAGLPQSPIVYSPYTNTGDLKEDQSYGLKRKDIVLFSMYREKAITKQEYEEAKAYNLTQDFLPKGEIQAEEHGFLYYTIYDAALDILVEKNAANDNVPPEELAKAETYNAYYQKAATELQNRGYTVKSTIDKDVYDAMQASAAEYGSYLDNGSSTPIETGNVLMDNKTGRIYGFVGSRDYESNQNNHAFNTARQAGSSIKPVLVYGPAIDQGLVGTETKVADYPAKYKKGEHAGKEIMNATNDGSKTFQSVRESIEQSTNIPAYHLYQDLLTKTGTDQYAYDHYLKKMNYPASDKWGVESAALGTLELTTLTQTNGFQALANGGVYQEGYLIESITDNHGNKIYEHKENPVQVYSPAAASIMNDLMRSVITAQETTPFKSLLSGVNYPLSQADWVGKTGTTDNYVDHWLIVSTPGVTLSSWTGHDNNDPMDEMAGDRNANYMANLANRIYLAKPEIFKASEEFKLSDDVHKFPVSNVTGSTSGKISHDGKTFEDPGKEVTSLWAKNEPPAAAYEFGIGGTAEEYKEYWDDKMKPASNRTTQSSTQQNRTQNNQNNNPSGFDIIRDYFNRN